MLTHLAFILTLVTHTRTQPPRDCLRVGSLHETSDARMFELPRHEGEIRVPIYNDSNITSSANCGMYFAVGDILCISQRELKVRRKWGLVVQLEDEHRAALGQNFTWGSCASTGGEDRRVLMQGLHRDSRLYLDRSGQRLFISHPGRHLVYMYHLIGSKFTHTGNRRHYDVVAGEDGELQYPTDVILLEWNAVTLSGDPGRYYGYIVVCDMHAHRVVLYPPLGRSPGKMARVLAGSGYPGSDLSSLNSPNAIAVDPDALLSELPYSSLFIADSGNGRFVRWRFGAARGELVALAQAHDLLIRPTELFFTTSSNTQLLRHRPVDSCSSPLISQRGPGARACSGVHGCGTEKSSLYLSIDLDSYPRELLRVDRSRVTTIVSSVDTYAVGVDSFNATGRVSFGKALHSAIIVSDAGDSSSPGWLRVNHSQAGDIGYSEIVVKRNSDGDGCVCYFIDITHGELIEQREYSCIIR
ncbi:hypothetical protein FOZ60_010499 [Perkinsus olseni]|uniref:Uncharacterized protein n=1 Tax=Perkinsus olseni TaxID=32597 RepID=A0A7J6PBJ9_PEROL|nr:hypothetical protein FOZ60_010499 [Perkinsus olseni]